VNGRQLMKGGCNDYGVDGFLAGMENRHGVDRFTAGMGKKYVLWLLLVAIPLWLVAQGSNLPVGGPAYHLLDRLEIKSGVLPPYHSSLKYYTRGDAVHFALSVDSSAHLSASDRRDLRHFYLDNNEWLGAPPLPQVIGEKRDAQLMVPASVANAHYETSGKPVLRYFYRTPANWFEVDGSYFHLRINPLINFQLSKEREDGKYWRFINQRGVEIRGGLDDRIFFYSKITDTQASFPDYVNQFIQKYHAWPGFAYFKSYKSSHIAIRDGRDNLNAEAYFGLNISKHVGMQFGHGSNFIGNGYRSMLLSNFSSNYLYLKLNWQFGPIRYQNLFAELTAQSRADFTGDRLLPKKYMAAHYFSLAFSKNFTLGLYEATIFTRDSEIGQFELSYLNPVILYRAVEHFIGSPDNVLLGLDAKVNLFRRAQAYGQLLIDEFNTDYFFHEQKGWWAKKLGGQLGMKYIDAFGVDHLDLQAEFNTARPYTYSHRDSLGASYSHYNMALAHPLGANFRESLLLLRYRPLEKWTLESRLILATKGEDSKGQNWGGNILLSYTTHVQDFGNVTGQGFQSKTTLFGLDLAFEAWHNVFFDLHYFYRKNKSPLPGLAGTDSYFGGGFRWNVFPNRMDF